MLAELSPVATNDSYFINSTGRTKFNVLADKVIFYKNLWDTPGTHQHDMHFYVATKALSFQFGAAKYFFANSCTGEYDTANKKNYASIQETFAGNRLKCKNLN